MFVHCNNSFPELALALGDLWEVCLNEFYMFNVVNIRATETQRGFKIMMILTHSLLDSLWSEREGLGVTALALETAHDSQPLCALATP